MYRKALAIDEAMGRKEGMAIQYGNLGNLFSDRGDLDGAEEMYRKSLALTRRWGGRRGWRTSMAISATSSATAAIWTGRRRCIAKPSHRRGDGRKEGMAADYGNLGLLRRARGDLDGAEEMYRKSLAIDEAMGRKEGMANQYGNLGNLLSDRGDLDGGGGDVSQSPRAQRGDGAKEGMAIQLHNLAGLRVDQSRPGEALKWRSGRGRSSPRWGRGIWRRRRRGLRRYGRRWRGEGGRPRSAVAPGLTRGPSTAGVSTSRPAGVAALSNARCGGMEDRVADGRGGRLMDRGPGSSPGASGGGRWRPSDRRPRVEPGAAGDEAGAEGVGGPWPAPRPRRGAGASVDRAAAARSFSPQSDPANGTRKGRTPMKTHLIAAAAALSLAAPAAATELRLSHQWSTKDVRHKVAQIVADEVAGG